MSLSRSCLRVFSIATDLEGAEVLVPAPLGSLRLRLSPQERRIRKPKCAMVGPLTGLARGALLRRSRPAPLRGRRAPDPSWRRAGRHGRSAFDFRGEAYQVNRL